VFSVGMDTSKVNEYIWFFNVGLSGYDGISKKLGTVKTLQTLLTENKHVDVRYSVSSLT